MDHDLENHEPRKIDKIIKKISGKKTSFLLMVLAGIILLTPLIFFVTSTLSEREKNPEIIGRDEEVFYPGAPYAEDQLIVKFKDEYTLEEILNLKKTLEDLGVSSQRKVFDTEDSNLKNIYLLTFRKGVDLESAARKLSELSEIEAVGANYIIKAQAEANDPGFGQQWDLEKIQIRQAWDKTKGSNDVIVAVIDTGIDYGHEDFVGRRIIKGPDLTRCARYELVSGGKVKCQEAKDPDADPLDNDDKGHGTHVAGVIGAVSNSSGIAGINWNVTLMVIKTNGGVNGDGYLSDVFDAMRYAVDNGAKIINMSLSAPFPCSNKSVIGYREVLNYAKEKKVTVVVAAGNSNRDAAMDSPGSCGDVITVGSIDVNNNRAASSNFGTKVDIAAPGVNILSTMPDDVYAFKSGTSMAAPHVSGVAALLLSVSPNLTPEQIKECIVKGATILTTDKYIGPLLNASGALAACSSSPSNTKASVTPTITPTTVLSGPSTTGVSSSTISPAKTGSAKTYTCRQKTSSRSPAGSIQIGDLECVPNF